MDGRSRRDHAPAGPLGWTFGRPIIVTDLRNPRNPRAYPTNPVDLFRRDGQTAYSHDVQVDDMGIAWVSGDGGTRGYWTSGRHFDPFNRSRVARHPLDPIPYGRRRTAGGGHRRHDRRLRAQRVASCRQQGAGRGSALPRRELLLATEEDFGPPRRLQNRGQFSIASLQGSFDGEAWRSIAGAVPPEVVGTWSPFEKEGSRPVGGPYDPLANFCSAHYFDVDGSTVTYAWYGEGTRFLDISDPANPTQFAYWRPDDGVVWASYMHEGYVYMPTAHGAWTCCACQRRNRGPRLEP